MRGNEDVPRELAKMDEKNTTNFLRQLVGRCEERGIAGATVKACVKTAKSWWSFNYIEVAKRVRVKDGAGRYDNEPMPTREELWRILDVSDMRGRWPSR